MIEIQGTEQEKKQILLSYEYRLNEAQRLCEQRQSECDAAKLNLIKAQTARDEIARSITDIETWAETCDDAQTPTMQARAADQKERLFQALKQHGEYISAAKSALNDAETALKAALRAREKADLKLGIAQKSIKKHKRLKATRMNTRAAEEAVSYRSVR